MPAALDVAARATAGTRQRLSSVGLVTARMISIFSEVWLGSAPVVVEQGAPVGLRLGLGAASAAAIRASTPSATSRSASSTSAGTMSASGTTRTILPRMNRWPFCLPGRDADVGLARLARAVDHAAHDRHLDRQVQLLERLLGLLGHGDDVDLGPAARRAGDEVEALALAQARATRAAGGRPGPPRPGRR